MIPWMLRRKELTDRQQQLNQELEYKELLYREVMRAKREWEQACWAFEEAAGEDEVDVAIYLLEAAERKYQIKLKEAKQAKVEWNVFKQGAYFGTS